MHNVDNRELIEGCRRNDRLAQRALYDTFAPLMFPVCLRYIGNETEAEDVLIDAFVTVFTHIGDVVKAGSLQSWIYAIVVNTSLQHLRKMKKQPLTESFEEYVGTHPSDEVPDDGLHTQWDPQRVMRVISEMPEKWRIIFNMHAIDDFSFREISEKTGINHNTVRVYYQRARAWALERLSKRGKEQ